LPSTAAYMAAAASAAVRTRRVTSWARTRAGRGGWPSQEADREVSTLKRSASEGSVLSFGPGVAAPLVGCAS
jgi:hypothetical protein